MVLWRNVELWSNHTKVKSFSWNYIIGVLQTSYQSIVTWLICSYFIWKINQFPEISRNYKFYKAMTIDRVQWVQYLGMMLDEKLYWHEHVNQTCASLIKVLIRYLRVIITFDKVVYVFETMQNICIWLNGTAGIEIVCTPKTLWSSLYEQ